MSNFNFDFETSKCTWRYNRFIIFMYFTRFFLIAKTWLIFASFRSCAVQSLLLIENGVTFLIPSLDWGYAIHNNECWLFSHRHPWYGDFSSFMNNAGTTMIDTRSSLALFWAFTISTKVENVFRCSNYERSANECRF